jgi:hypothetical protein
MMDEASNDTPLPCFNWMLFNQVGATCSNVQKHTTAGCPATQMMICVRKTNANHPKHTSIIQNTNTQVIESINQIKTIT